MKANDHTNLILAIERLEDKKFNLGRWISDYGHLFPGLIEKTRHDIDICERAIARLEQRYNRLISIK